MPLKRQVPAEYVRKSHSATGVRRGWKIFIWNNHPTGLRSQAVNRRFDSRAEAEAFRSGIRLGIDLERNRR